MRICLPPRPSASVNWTPGTAAFDTSRTAPLRSYATCGRSFSSSTTTRIEAVTLSSPARCVAVMVAVPGCSIDVTRPRTTVAVPALDVAHATASVTSTLSWVSPGDAATCATARQLSASPWPSHDTLSTGVDVAFADVSGCALHAATTMFTPTSANARRDLNNRRKYA